MITMGIFADLLPTVVVWLKGLQPFWATVMFALLLTLVSSIATKFLVNLELVKTASAEYSGWLKELRKAQKEGDTQKVQKLMKRQRAITAKQSRASLERFKVFPVTIIPFYLVFDILTVAFSDGPVAVSPVALPFTAIDMGTGLTNLGVFGFYLLASFALGIPVSKIFGIYPERE